MTVKAGQKCTAIRRAMVPEHCCQRFNKRSLRACRNVIGDLKLVWDEALCSQIGRVETEMNKLMAEQVVFNPDLDLVGTTLECVPTPKLFVNSDPFAKTKVHEVEPFGPVALMRIKPLTRRYNYRYGTRFVGHFIC